MGVLLANLNRPKQMKDAPARALRAAKASGEVTVLVAGEAGPGHLSWIDDKVVASDRLELTSATCVVSGGNGIGPTGAHQHLAGMTVSIGLLAKNMDAEAQISHIAYYALAGDLFQVVPKLKENL